MNLRIIPQVPLPAYPGSALRARYTGYRYTEILLIPEEGQLLPDIILDISDCSTDSGEFSCTPIRKG